MTLHTDLHHELPLPLAQLLVRALNHKNPQDLHGNAYYLGEAALKLAAAGRIGSYLAHALVADTELSRSLEALCLPSFGQWVGFLRDTSGVLAETLEPVRAPFAGADIGLRTGREEWGAVDLLLERLAGEGIVSREDRRRPQRQGVLGFFEVFARYRNEVIGHTGQRSTRYYEEMGRLLLDAVCEVIQCPALFDGLRLALPRLVADAAGIEATIRWYDATGPTLLPMAGGKSPPGVGAVPGRLYLVAGHTTVALHPLVVYREEEERHRFGFLNRTVRRTRHHRGGATRIVRRVHYLDYATGDQLPGVEAADALTSLLGRLRGDERPSPDSVERLVETLSEMPPEVDAEAPPVEGRVLGDFELLGELGRGSMGIVYRARQQSLGRIVALKELPPALLADPIALGRFRREIRALGAVDHPNVVKILTSGRDGDHIYYAMEFVEGSDLAGVQDRLAGHRAADVDARDLGGNPGDFRRKLAGLFAQAADGVQELHVRGIVHRDLKPANLMLTSSAERLVVMDLGLAQIEDAGAALSVAGGFVGTPRFAAPEQLSTGHHVDHRADIYALGASLYELACLAPLYDGDTEDRIRSQKISQEPEAPSRRDRRFPRDLATVVMKCLERNPADRYTDAGELAEDLRRFRDGLPVSARPASFGRNLAVFLRRYKREVAAASAVLLLAVVAAIAFIVHLKNQRDREAGLRTRAERARERTERALSRAYQEQARRLAIDGRHGQAALAAALARRVKDSPEARARWRAIVGEPDLVVSSLWKRPVSVGRLAAIVPAGPHLFLVENLPAGEGFRCRVVVLRAEDGLSLTTINAADQKVQTAAWSGGTLLLATMDGALDALDVRNPEAPRRIGRYQAHEQRIMLLRITGRRLYSLAEGGRFKVWPWPLGTGAQPKAELSLASREPPFSLAAARAGDLVAVGGYHGFVRVWQCSGTRWPHSLGHPALTGERIRGLAWRLEEGAAPLLFTAGSKGSVLTWSLQERSADGEPGTSRFELRPQAPVHAPKEPIRKALQVGDHLYLAGKTGIDEASTIRAIHLGKRRQEAVLPGHRGSISFLAASADGTTLYSVAADDTLRAWDLERGPSVWKRERPGSRPCSALLALPDGGLVAAAGNRLDRYTAHGVGFSLQTSWTLSSDVTELAIAGGHVTVLDSTGKLVVVDPATGKQGVAVSLPAGSRSLVGESLKLRAYVLTPATGSATRINLETGRIEKLPVAGQRLGALAFASGRLFAATLKAGLLRLEGDEWIEVTPDRSRARASSTMAVSGDGRYAAVEDGTGRIHVHRTDTGSLRTMQAFRYWIPRIRMAGAGEGIRVFWLANNAARIAFCAPEATEPVMLQPGHRGAVADFAILDGGGRLVTAGTDGALRILDIDFLTRVPTADDIRRLEENSGFFLDGSRFEVIGDGPLPDRGFRSCWGNQE